MFADFAAVLRVELDYRLEANNADTIRAEFGAASEVVVPAVMDELTTSGLLVMDLVTGVPLADQTALTASGLDRTQLAGSVVRAYLTMVLSHESFHADPHPGNLFALADGRLAIVDYGEVGHVSAATRAVFSRLLVAVAVADPVGVADAVMAICHRTRPVDPTALGNDVNGLLAPMAGETLAGVRFGPLISGVMVILRRHGLQLPTDLGLLLKTVIECEATAREIDDGFELTTVLALGTGIPTLGTSPARDAASPGIGPSPGGPDPLRRSAADGG